MKAIPISQMEWLTKPPARIERVQSKPVDAKCEPAKRISFPKQQEQPKLQDPKITDMAANLAGALMDWAKAGFPVLSDEDAEARGKVCTACDKWQPDARGGLGKCMHVKCGCSKFKWWLKTSKCPEGKWG